MAVLVLIGCVLVRVAHAASPLGLIISLLCISFLINVKCNAFRERYGESQMTEFTPVSALLGGALIGVSAVLMMAMLGRIAGISGILGGLLAPSEGGWGWKFAFVAGIVVAPLIYGAVMGAPADISLPHSVPLMVIGGLLVGFGTRLGGGCTSGHGVCGIARLSPRSIVATLVFMAAGFVTVFVLHHLGGVS
ncbi:MAG: YeeE/YedE family protein [Alphaproteobacteria bacterium]|nr:MAG: YeeE/YedE family protein [Alphaproteobacteria bacterium]